MISSSKIRLPVLSFVALLIGLSMSIAPVLADGTVLRSFDVPVVQQLPRAIYFPLGITFDGANLYYSQPSNDNNRIFHITTTGTVLSTLTSVDSAGALAWDGSHLWAGIFAKKGETCVPGVPGCALLFQIDVTTGSVIKTVDISSIFAADQECNAIDGLSFDLRTGTIWVSPDVGCAGAFTNPCSIGFAYQIDTSGNLLTRLKFSFGVSGVAIAGNHLWVVDRCPDNTYDQVDPSNGNIQSSFPLVKVDPRSWGESIAFDSTTFAPSCTLWAMQPYHVSDPTTFNADVVAYQAACP